ncbi:MAG: HAD family phosphatase [Flavobacteriales bacterium]|jgi:beta-phosphoglucomutase|nr:HAD family phosphatase [Flavobacteriales bacterium]
MNNQIKAVIFDLDGVLIEAKDWHYEALNRALRLFGFTISRYDHLVTFDGLPTVTKLNMLSQEKGLPIGLHDFINELKQKYTMELIYANCKPRFYHEYALSKLKSDGYSIGCASNSMRDSINIMLEKSSLDIYMDVIFSAQDVDNPKPAPDMYDQSIQKLGLKPKNCLIIEDNQNGIIAAKASGGHLLIVDDVKEVNIKNIYNKINEINNQKENK